MKRILFVCVENSCRSQMADGFAQLLGAGMLESFSAGSRPSGKVNPDAVKVMGELGIDISGFQSKGFSDLPMKSFDWVVTMGCGDVCPFVPSKHRLDWKIEDPKGHDLDFFRSVREKIQEQVKDVIAQIEISNQGVV